MTHPDPTNVKYARSLSIIAPINYDLFSQWDNTTVHHRPDGYHHLKQTLAKQTLDTIFRYEGPIPITGLTTASPLTYRDYYGTTNGSLYGLRKTFQTPASSMISTRTRFDNLFLCGQDINYHGLLGAALSSILTVESIMGCDVLMGLDNDSFIKH